MANSDEDMYLEKLRDFKKIADDFNSWKKIREQHRLAVVYSKTKRKRSAWHFLTLMFVGLLAYFCYWIELPIILQESECIIPIPEIIQDLWRPPVESCDFCQISSIHIRNNLTADEFYEEYAYSGLPLLVSDGMKDWTTDIFSFDYFRQLYADTTDEENEQCQFFGYRTHFKSLDDVFDMPDNRANFLPGHEPWYIGWSNCIPDITATLREHYTVPYFLGYSERTREDWMFMGSPGYKGAPLHIDSVQYNSWQAQIKGRKKWEFVPPPECWSECPHNHTVVVEPGNVFVFDSNRWYHSTEVLEGEYSLTIGAEYD